jgi:predicted acyltransferase
MDSNERPDHLPAAADDEQAEVKHHSRRLASLDAFRGLTVLMMLLVNNLALDGKSPLWLTHARWDRGLYLADIVFPWFLFILGVAVPYSAASNKRKGYSFGRFVLKILERTGMLIFLGMLIDSSVARRPVVGLGVLQIIGLAYMTAALLYALRPAWRLTIAAAFLLSHWALIKFFPIPGIGAGMLTESVNPISYLNRVYLHAYHLDGLISIIPTSALAMIGTAIGDVLASKNLGPKLKTVTLLCCGAAMAVAGLYWSVYLPINKPLWTASFMLLNAGMGTVVLGVMYLVIDVRGLRGWDFPLIVFGMNALVGYVAPILLKAYILLGWTCGLPNGGRASLQEAFIKYFKFHAGEINGGWMYTCAYILFWWLILLCMYKKRVFVKV